MSSFGEDVNAARYEAIELAHQLSKQCPQCESTGKSLVEVRLALPLPNVSRAPTPVITVIFDTETGVAPDDAWMYCHGCRTLYKL